MLAAGADHPRLNVPTRVTLRVQTGSGAADDLCVSLDVTEAGHLERLAAAHRFEADRVEARARCHRRGDSGEDAVRALLAPMAGEGWHLLHRRQWPGTPRADIDHLLVGPGGVVVLDTKAWRGDVRVEGGRLWQGQDGGGEAVDKLVAQVHAVEDVLAPHGLAPLEVVGGLVFVGQPLGLVLLGRAHLLGADHLLRWLRARGRRLDPDAVIALAAVLSDAVPPLPNRDTAAVPVVRLRPAPRAAPEAPLFDVHELDLADIERASRGQLEQWMVYLAPAQLDVVRRRYGGPSRVRGAAGCGKTVVALHRAAYLLSQEPGELLFLSYVRTLPVVLAQLYERLSPHTAQRATFRGVHQLALDVLAEAGVGTRLDLDAAGDCLARAWLTGRGHLERPGLGFGYWREEVSSVIKGRGLEGFEQYVDLPRTGRRTPLSGEQRARVWDLYVDYQQRLEARGVHDLEDVVGLALQVARHGQARRYRFVVVDEAQDLDLQCLRLAAALVSDEPDGLTLVGDGQQAVYPGGYTLKEAGLSVTGRSTVLSVNYRNTREVLAAAHEVVRGDDFDDLEGLAETVAEVRAVRAGAAVLRVSARDARSADVALVVRLTDDLALGLPVADAAVLCRTGAEAARVRALLRGAGIPVLDLCRYDGRPAQAVKVGTVHRAKGLEFGQVYLPRGDGYPVAEGSAEPERVQRARREMFVAMTRARDGLWLCQVRSLSAPAPPA